MRGGWRRAGGRADAESSMAGRCAGGRSRESTAGPRNRRTAPNDRAGPCSRHLPLEFLDALARLLLGHVTAPEVAAHGHRADHRPATVLDEAEAELHVQLVPAPVDRPGRAHAVAAPGAAAGARPADALPVRLATSSRNASGQAGADDCVLALVPAAPAGPAGVPVPARSGAWSEILLDPAGAVRVPHGCALDLGATAKAWASDLIASSIASEVDSSLVISLGGDVAVAGPGGGWPVAVSETIDDSADAEIVHLPYGGMATSSTGARRWIRGGVVRHHVLDPLTGEPTRGRWRTVTATGATCLAANTASTAAIVLGDKAVGWLTDRDIPARLVDGKGRIVRTARWPEPEVSR